MSDAGVNRHARCLTTRVPQNQAHASRKMSVDIVKARLPRLQQVVEFEVDCLGFV